MHKSISALVCLISLNILSAASTPVSLDKEEMIQQLISAHPDSLLADIYVAKTLTLFEQTSDYQEQLLKTVSTYINQDEPRILSSALIDRLIEQAQHATCSQEYMRSMLARCSLCLAERINFYKTQIWQIQVMKPHQYRFYAPREEFAAILNCTGATNKSVILYQLLYAALNPIEASDEIVHLFLHNLGCHELCSTSDSDEIPTPINGPLANDAATLPDTVAAHDSKFFWQDAQVKLAFIKQLLPFMAPTNAKSSAREAYFYGLIHPFMFIRDTEKQSQNDKPIPAYYINSNVAKIALILEYFKASDVLKFTHWLFDLFQDMQP